MVSDKVMVVMVETLATQLPRMARIACASEYIRAQSTPEQPAWDRRASGQRVRCDDGVGELRRAGRAAQVTRQRAVGEDGGDSGVEASGMVAETQVIEHQRGRQHGGRR